MPSYDIEIILSRQLADSLSMPVFITDIEGNLIYYNEPAEEILGKRFEETGVMPVEVWGKIFKPMDEFKTPIAAEELPLVKTLRNVYPYHKSFWIESLQGKSQKISVTSFPIIGRSGNFSGGIAIFWTDERL